MKNYVVGTVMLAWVMVSLPSESWAQGTSFKVGTPTPMVGSAPAIQLRRPQPLPQPTYDTQVRPVSYSTPIAHSGPTFRAKIDIPRALPGAVVGLMPVMQGELPEAGPPRSEDIPVMPKKLGNSVVETITPPPATGFQPLPDNIMPYADGAAPPPEGSIVAYPEGGMPVMEGDCTYCGTPVAIGDCCCSPANGICEPCTTCCTCTPCCPKWGSWWHNRCWGCGWGGCGGCGCCDCYPRSCRWVSAEFLYMNFNRQNVPPLLTTSNQADEGILGAPSTRVLYGEDELNQNNWHPGVRLGAGFWFHKNPCWGLDASVFYIPKDYRSFTRASGGNPLLARPFFNVDTGAQDSVLVAKIGDPTDPADPPIAGVITITNYSRLWGFDTNLRRKWCCGCNYHWDLLVGYRHIRLDEGIEIFDFEAIDAEVGFDRQIANDFFRTSNTFQGGQIGIDGEYRFNSRWSLGTTVKVGIGNVRQTSSIFGFTDITDGATGGQVTGRGGILALNSNIGTQTRNKFAVAPELQLKLQYRLNEKWQAYVGYDILMISSVVRPGDQIDVNLDPNQFPTFQTPNPTGFTRPAVLFNTSTFIAQGVNFGVICNY